jgi:uncharacterized protein
MSNEVAHAVAAGIADSWPSRGKLEIVWHGGEPLATGRARLVELFTAFEPLRIAGRIQHVVQTNATLITDPWCEVFAAFDVAVGVSIDGPFALNRHRMYRRGRSAHDRIEAGIGVLKKNGVPYTAISVVSRDGATQAVEILEFLDALGCSLVGFNMEEREGVNTTGDGTPSFDAARRFWRDVFAWSAANPRLEIREVRHLLHYLSLNQDARMGDERHDTIPTVGYNGDVVVLSPELLGIHDPRYNNFVAGNVLRKPLSSILKGAPDLNYVREFVTGVRRCREQCQFFAYCQGSHAGNRYFEHGSFTATETAHCRTSTQALVLALHDVAYPEEVRLYDRTGTAGQRAVATSG